MLVLKIIYYICSNYYKGVAVSLLKLWFEIQVKNGASLFWGNIKMHVIYKRANSSLYI